MSPSTTGQSRLSRYMTYGMLVWVALLIGFFLAQRNQPPGGVDVLQAEGAADAEKGGPPRGYDSVRDVSDSVKAAKMIDGQLVKSTPGADKIIEFVDVSNRDGHLVVHFKEIYNVLSMSEKAPLEDDLVRLWGASEYVSQRKWNPNVEIVEHAGKGTRSRMKTPGDVEPLEPAAGTPAGRPGS